MKENGLPPLREAIQAFVESTQKYVTGEVKMKLYKGNIIKAGTTSPYSLYNESPGFPSKPATCTITRMPPASLRFLACL